MSDNQWTGISLSRLINRCGYKGAADNHNAALAASIRAQMDKDDEMWSAKLAAEREKVDDFIRSNDELTTEVLQLREQLAAEREKVQPLVDALKLMPEIAYKSIIEGAGVTVENLPNELQCVCDAALAKVGK